MTAVGFFKACCVGGSPDVVGARAEVLEKPADKKYFSLRISRIALVTASAARTPAEWSNTTCAPAVPIAGVMYGQVGCRAVKWGSKQLDPLITQAWCQLLQTPSQSHRVSRLRCARGCDGATNLCLVSAHVDVHAITVQHSSVLLCRDPGKHSCATSKSPTILR